MHMDYAGNNAEHRRISHDFFQGISFCVYSEISCFLTILYGTKRIVCDKRTSPPYKIGHIFTKRATAYVKVFVGAMQENK